MAKYSRVYQFGGRKFRYRYDDSIVELVYKPDKEMIEDNKEWVEKYGHPLWDIVNGYCVMDGVGLRRENWVNKDVRDEYLFEWCGDLDVEDAIERESFEKYELPLIRKEIAEGKI